MTLPTKNIINAILIGNVISKILYFYVTYVQKKAMFISGKVITKIFYHNLDVLDRITNIQQ